MTEIIPPMLPLLAIMIGVLLFVTYAPKSFMWLPRAFGFAVTQRDCQTHRLQRELSLQLRAAATSTVNRVH
jgi:hypothetical protein